MNVCSQDDNVLRPMTSPGCGVEEEVGVAVAALGVAEVGGGVPGVLGVALGTATGCWGTVCITMEPCGRSNG